MKQDGRKVILMSFFVLSLFSISMILYYIPSHGCSIVDSVKNSNYISSMAKDMRNSVDLPHHYKESKITLLNISSKKDDVALYFNLKYNTSKDGDLLKVYSNMRIYSYNLGCDKNNKELNKFTSLGGLIRYAYIDSNNDNLGYIEITKEKCIKNEN